MFGLHGDIQSDKLRRKLKVKAARDVLSENEKRIILIKVRRITTGLEACDHLRLAHIMSKSIKNTKVQLNFGGEGRVKQKRLNWRECKGGN